MTKWLVIALQVVVTILCVASVPSKEALVAQIKTRLEEGSGGKPIKLRIADNFLEPPGAVIFLSEERGRRILIDLARADEPELSILFLPERGAWITQSLTREKLETKIDDTYLAAACGAGMQVRMGHFHTSDEDWDENLHDALPSEWDAGSLFARQSDCPYADMRGFVASKLGVVEYWSDDHEWTKIQHYYYQVQSETAVLRREAMKMTSLGAFSRYVNEYKGLLKFHFTPATY